jgi:hypothetical protein
VKLRIVYAVTPDRMGPDLDRIGTVEDIPDELARLMVDGGEAVPATDEEIAAAEDSSTAGAESDLSARTKAELLDLAGQHGVDVPASARKDEVVAALTDAGVTTPAPVEG